MANKKKNTKQGTNSTTKFVFWMVALVAVCIAVFIFISNQSDKKEENATTKVTKIDYSNQPFLGKETAPVAIIEFGDYKCPACKDFSLNVVPEIQKEFVDTGKAKFYFMHDSFINTDSTRSAQFAESVFHELGNETFWKFHELLYEKQPEDEKAEKADVFTEQFLADTLKEVANDQEVEKVVNHFKDKKSVGAWEKDMDYVKKLNVTGTPTLFVNGKLFTGKTMDDLKAMIEKAAKEK
ncbi:DsbA family protein [Bacillus rubiinfantis]|uniref:DsbA family protein n=1 Tax=Bacillus rubiinfantis TaxID=1499680 RepID=UPI0005A80D3B|nr:thioredoxin domain-containing protein [Bacillus rubiinfantis]